MAKRLSDEQVVKKEVNRGGGKKLKRGEPSCFILVKWGIRNGKEIVKFKKYNSLIFLY